MAFQKGQSGNPRGKPKGAVNQTTRAAKSAIEAAAEGLGSTARLIAWAKEDPLNERAFWTQIYTKLLPLQVSGDPDAPLISPGTAIHFIVTVDSEAKNRT